MAVARETLERALQLSYQLNLELNFMTDWLDHLVTEIQKTEDIFVDNSNSADEIRFYEVVFSPLAITKEKAILSNYDVSFFRLIEMP